MTLQQLRYITAIARCGSVSQAARELFIAQPSISKAISELEKELGKKLFERTPRGMLFTNEGVEFLTYARQILQQIEALEKRYEIGKEVTHYFTVSSQHFPFAAEAFSRITKSVTADCYELMFLEGETQTIIDNVRDLKSEIGILHMTAQNSMILTRILKEAHLQFEPLFETLPYICLSRQHPLAQKSVLNLNELSPYPFLTYQQNQNSIWSMAEIMLRPEPVSQRITIADRASAEYFMITSNAYAITTGDFGAALSHPGLIYLPLLGEGKITVGQIRNEHMMISKMALRFLEAIQDIIMENDILSEK